MPNVSRETLLHCLESSQAGLSPKEIIEQSNCFVFVGGDVLTYNDEIACRMASPLNGITGAVPSKNLLDILRKLKEDEVSVEMGEGEILIRGKGGRRSCHRIDKEVTLPLDMVEAPKKWKPLHEDFAEAVKVVSRCAGRDESRFYSVCMHVTPDFVEAFDDFQLCRWGLPTPVKRPFLVRSSSVRHITALGMKEFSETASWVHFRNSVGLVMSCRRYTETEDFPDLSPFLKVDGVSVTLPKGLPEAIDRAKVFVEEGTDSSLVKVSLKSGRMSVRSEGVHGWYVEPKKVPYAGPPMAFFVSPDLLSELVKSHNSCVLSESRLKVDTGSFEYVAVLSAVEENGEGESEGE